MSDLIEQTKMLYGEHPRVMELIAEVERLKKFEWMYEASKDDQATIIRDLQAEVERLKSDKQYADNFDLHAEIDILQDEIKRLEIALAESKKKVEELENLGPELNL